MFDVVVGGGGAAGCVVAARVAEARSHSVLLLEAGPDRRADTPPELRNGWTIEPEPFDWGQLQSGVWVRSACEIGTGCRGLDPRLEVRGSVLVRERVLGNGDSKD